MIYHLAASHKLSLGTLKLLGQHFCPLSLHLSALNLHISLQSWVWFETKIYKTFFCRFQKWFAWNKFKFYNQCTKKYRFRHFSKTDVWFCMDINCHNTSVNCKTAVVSSIFSFYFKSVKSVVFTISNLQILVPWPLMVNKAPRPDHASGRAAKCTHASRTQPEVKFRRSPTNIFKSPKFTYYIYLPKGVH